MALSGFIHLCASCLLLFFVFQIHVGGHLVAVRIPQRDSDHSFYGGVRSGVLEDGHHGRRQVAMFGHVATPQG